MRRRRWRSAWWLVVLAWLAALAPGLLLTRTVHATESPFDEIRAKAKKGSVKKKRKTRKRRKRPPPPKPPIDEVPPPTDAPEPTPEPDTVTESEYEEESEAQGPLRLELQGFVMSRYLAAREDSDAGLYGIMPSSSARRAFFEANLQPRVKALDERLALMADASLYIATRAPKALVLVNEAYVDWRVAQAVRLLAGRRRLVWGSGLAANPTDLLSPPKNPMDVDQQRMGAFLLPMVDVTLGPVTFSALASPPTTTNRHAVPDHLAFDESLVAARLYALILDIDTNLIYYHDFGRDLDHVGFSVSYILGDMYELHAEGLAHVQESTPLMLAPMAICGSGPPEDQRRATGALLAGGRVLWSDQSILGAEYLYSGDGLGRGAFDTLRDQLPCIRTMLQLFPQPAANPIGHPLDPAVWMLRRHYLILVYQQPHLTARLFEDLAVGAALTLGLEDFSSMLMLSAGYRLTDGASVAVRLLRFGGPKDSEFSLSPTGLAATIDLNVLY